MPYSVPAIVKPFVAHVAIHISLVIFGSEVAKPVRARAPPSTTHPEATQEPGAGLELELEFEPLEAAAEFVGAAAEAEDGAEAGAEGAAPLVKRLSDQVPPQVALLSPLHDM